MMTAKKKQRAVEPEEVVVDEGDVGEVQLSEYLMLLFAVDVFARHVEDTTLLPANDAHTVKGIRLLQQADLRYADAIKSHIIEKLPNEATQAMVARTFRVRLSNEVQVGRRVISLRTALNRSSAILKAVFEESRPRNAVKASMAASMTEDAAPALARFESLPVRNVLIKTWIRRASELVGSGEVIHNPVQSASAAALDHVETLKSDKVSEESTTGAAEVKALQDARAQTLQKVQDEATEAARTALEVSGKEDRPLTHSEVIGVATAVAAAQAADITHSVNVPVSLKTLDAEQQAAALTDGLVLVAAGAGAGKSTTLVARIKYLVEERGVPPEKIIAMSFNRKAGKELEAKVIKALGPEKAKRMQVGTLHSLFRKSITKYGTPLEKMMFEGSDSLLKGDTIATTVNQIWRKCYAKWDPEREEFKDADAPSAKQMMLHKTKFLSNGISPAQAKEAAVSVQDQQIARWYEMYEALKGRVPWGQDDCSDARSVRAIQNNFVRKHRTVQDGDVEKVRKIGDFDDMIRVFADILERSPEIRKRAQKAFQHVMVDECQDLNPEQYRALKYLTEHVTDGKDGSSFWMVGDPDQSIYAFRGARPELFVGLDGAEGWKTRLIRTNYRCPPEVVDCANKLIAHNTQRMEKDALPAPTKPRGEASIEASVYRDEAETALTIASEIEARWAHGKGVPAEDNAVLCATNSELDAYELALLTKGIPYARKGATSFLSSPETKAFLGYMSLVTDADGMKSQEALAAILNKPNRFFVNDEKKLKQAVKFAVNNYAKRKNVTISEVDAVVAMRDVGFQRDIIKGLDKTSSRSAPRLMEELSDQLNHLSTLAQDEKTTTQELFNAILEVPGLELEVDPDNDRRMIEKTVSFRESLMRFKQDAVGGDIEDESESDEGDDLDAPVGVGPASGLGTISFLYELSNTDPNDEMDSALPPDKPKGFWAKMERLKERAGELRYDLNKWKGEGPPPGVYLGTVHCSPADEPVLTTEGWVPIGSLDPDKHRLASYTHTCNQLFWGQVKGEHDGIAGYGFVKAVNRYEGPLLTLTTPKSRTRVTPDHRIRVKWSESFFNKYVVYLMRRGDWWRVGLAKSGNRPYGGSDFKQRVSAEKADACWILSVHSTRVEAALEEARVQGRYGITGLTFEASSHRRTSSEQLQAIHESIKSATGERVLRLLSDYGFDKRHPLYVGQGRDMDMRSAFDIQARNCLSGYMVLPVASEAFIECSGPREVWTKPEWHEVSVSREPFVGDVYSLVVLPHRYYVSGGAVVHNSVKGAQWPYVTVQMTEGRFPMPTRHDTEVDELTPEMQAQEDVDLEGYRRLAYVALTRPSKELRVVAPEKYNGKRAGMSRFLAEAGLTLGENVKPVPIEGAAKTAKFFFEDAGAF